MAVVNEVRNIVGEVVCVGKTRDVLFKIPGIVTGAAYAAGDAVGIQFGFDVGCPSGVIHTALLFDLDDEGIELYLHLYKRPIVGTADNAAYAPSDAEELSKVGTLDFTTFINSGNNQSSQISSAGIAFVCDQSYAGNLFAQAATNGAPNIAAGNDYWIRLTILAD